ncbi:Required for meiotic nuclear division protein 1 -like protein, partial [Trichinella patagoniensis]
LNMALSKTVMLTKFGVSSAVAKKVRPSKRILPQNVVSPAQNIFAFATADSYRFKELIKGIKKENFTVTHISSELPDVVYVQQKFQQPGEAFVFYDGGVVFWDFTEKSRREFLNAVQLFEESPYEDKIVESEEENLSYVFSEQSKAEFRQETFLLPTQISQETSTLYKFAVSNAMFLSVKLSIWESLLDDFVASSEDVVEHLQLGRITLSKSEVLRRAGKLFMLRHRISLCGDLLDAPDFYWDKQDLERIYSEAFSLFNMGKRTRVVNEKLTYCLELLQLLDGNISQVHSVRLEVMIIVLILIEVLFEILHFSRHYSN